MIMYRGVDVELHAFLNSALDISEWSASHPGRFASAERIPGIHWTGGWVGPKASLDAAEESLLLLQGIEIRSPGCPAPKLATVLTEADTGIKLLNP
jgi:hypothetical protein